VLIPDAGEQKRGVQGYLGYLLRQATASVRAAHDAAFAELGLTTPQFLVMTMLHAYPEASGADLARITILTPQTVNLILRKLERDGLIQRRQHAVHGRVLTLSLTASGERQLAECKRRSAAIEKKLRILAERLSAERKIRRWLVEVAKI